MKPKGYRKDKPRVRVTLKDMQEYIILESTAKQLHPEMSVAQFLRYCAVKLVNDAMSDYMETQDGEQDRPSREASDSVETGHGQTEGDNAADVSTVSGSSTESAESGTGAS